MRKRVYLVGIVVVLAILVSLVGCTQATQTQTQTTTQTNTVTQNETSWDQPEITARLIHSYPADSFINERAQHFADLVFDGTKGRMKINIYPAGTLYGYSAGCEALMTGAVELSADTDYWWVSILPVLLLDYTPGFWEGPEHALRWATDTNGIHSVVGPMYESNGVKFLAGWPESIWVWYINKQKEVKTLTDMEGMRIYLSPPGTDMAKIWAGMDMVSMPFEETTPSFETGILDIWVGNSDNSIGMGIYKLGKHAFGWPEGCSITQVVANMNWWNNLPSDVQQVVSDAAMATTQWSYERLLEREEENYQFLKENMESCNVVRAGTPEFTEILEGCRPLIDEFLAGASAIVPAEVVQKIDNLRPSND